MIPRPASPTKAHFPNQTQNKTIEQEEEEEEEEQKELSDAARAHIEWVTEGTDAVGFFGEYHGKHARWPEADGEEQPLFEFGDARSAPSQPSKKRTATSTLFGQFRAPYPSRGGRSRHV